MPLRSSAEAADIKWFIWTCWLSWLFLWTKPNFFHKNWHQRRQMKAKPERAKQEVQRSAWVSLGGVYSLKGSLRLLAWIILNCKGPDNSDSCFSWGWRLWQLLCFFREPDSRRKRATQSWTNSGVGRGRQWMALKESSRQARWANLILERP